MALRSGHTVTLLTSANGTSALDASRPGGAQSNKRSPGNHHRVGQFPGCVTSQSMDSLTSDLAIATTVERAAAGDEYAFARIVAMHRAEMVRVAYVVSGDWDLAQDAAQAALWKAWRKLPSLRDPASLRPWLMSVAANEARVILRRERRHPVVELAVASETSGRHEPADGIDQLDLTNALRHLSPDDRALLAVRYVADLDSGKIGAVTGRSASGVRTRLSRVLARLQRDLDHE